MKKGYTLAETLITLAIIGVIAAVITPALMKKQPNVEMLKFKKAYSLVDRTVGEMINDESLYPDDTRGLDDTRAARYEGRTYSGATKFCGIVAAKLGNIPPENSCPTFTTTDGIQWTIPEGDFSEPITITIDVDGPNKGENTPATDDSLKPDQFTININQSGRVSTRINSLEDFYVKEQDNTKTFKKLKEEQEINFDNNNN